MLFETLQDERDREAGIEEMANELPPPVNALLRQFTVHGLSYSKETLIALVPYVDSVKNYYNLGAILHYIQRRCTYREFRDVLVDNEISSRMAAYLMAIYVKFNALKIPCPTEISWRTLGEAVRIMNALNYQEIIGFCRENSAEDVREYIKRRGRNESI